MHAPFFLASQVRDIYIVQSTLLIQHQHCSTPLLLFFYSAIAKSSHYLIGTTPMTLKSSEIQSLNRHSASTGTTNPYFFYIIPLVSTSSNKSSTSVSPIYLDTHTHTHTHNRPCRHQPSTSQFHDATPSKSPHSILSTEPAKNPFLASTHSLPKSYVLLD